MLALLTIAARQLILCKKKRGLFVLTNSPLLANYTRIFFVVLDYYVDDASFDNNYFFRCLAIQIFLNVGIFKNYLFNIRWLK